MHYFRKISLKDNEKFQRRREEKFRKNDRIAGECNGKIYKEER